MLSSCSAKIRASDKDLPVQSLGCDMQSKKGLPLKVKGCVTRSLLLALMVMFQIFSISQGKTNQG